MNKYIEAGSLYIMSGDARYKWKHGIKRKMYDGIKNNKKRLTIYSLTYIIIIK